MLEAWTTLAALPSMTKHLKIGTMFIHQLPASFLACENAATVDLLSHGRLILGIGAGYYEEEFGSYGFDFPNVPLE